MDLLKEIELLYNLSNILCSFQFTQAYNFFCLRISVKYIWHNKTMRI